MRIVIAGASALGVAAGRKLIEAEHEVVIIDRDRSRLEQLSDILDCGLIEGDATHPSTLREAAGDAADALLALTSADEHNILCALIGRSVGFGRVVPQIIDPELCSVCDELGLEHLITPHQTVAASLVDILEDREDTEIAAHLSGDLRLMRFGVSGALVERSVDTLPLGDRGRVIALRRGDEECLTGPDTQLKDGDELLILALRAEVGSIAEDLKQERESKA